MCVVAAVTGAIRCESTQPALQGSIYATRIIVGDSLIGRWWL